MGCIKVDPPYWWTGMRDSTLQLMVSARNIGDAEFSVNYPGVRIDRQFRLDSPNYRFIYLTILPDAKPGVLRLNYVLGGRKSAIRFSLHERDTCRRGAAGFDAGDVLYLLMPDRFARGVPADKRVRNKGVASLTHPTTDDRENPDARHGGNIAGIREHLDYLDSLGVTAIWVGPVLENDMPGGSYHGYATTDYYRVDPRLGTNDEWREMVEVAHRRGLKVVMDMIFNHTGSEHRWLKDSPSADWYNHPAGDKMTNYRLTTLHDPYVSQYDLDRTVNGWFVPSMPDLNQRNPEVMRYLTQNSIWWIEQSGIDGIRMDTYPYADMQAMSKWCADVLREYPDLNIVGECWYVNEAGAAYWQRGNRLNTRETNLPTVMDFWPMANARRAFGEPTECMGGLNEIYDHLAQDFLFPDPQRILTFLDNHDTDRFLCEAPETEADLGPWKQAMTWLLTTRGIPQIYYGTELLMSGTKARTDGDVRRDMPGGFPEDETDCFDPAGRTPLQREAWDFLSGLLHFRRGEMNDVIAQGSLKHFMPEDGVYVYERRLGDRSVTVLMNGNDEPRKIDTSRISEILPPGSVRTDIISGEPVRVEPEMSFGPRQILILV